MKKEDAIRLDNLLAKFPTDNWHMNVPSSDNSDCELLEAYGYIEIINRPTGGYFIMLTETGNRFRLTSSFTEKAEEEQNKKEIERLNADLTKRQLSAIKREPYLIIWGIIATVISILLAVFK